MLEGAADHVGGWFFTVMEIVWPTDIAGAPLSIAMTLKLQVCAGVGAVNSTLQFWGLAPEPLTVTPNPHVVPLFEQVKVCPVSTSVAIPFIWLYVESPVMVMSVGAATHVGALSFMVIEIVWPTEIAGEPLSTASILKLQVWAGTGAVKLTLQFAGKPEPLTVMAKPQEAPLDEQVSVWPISTSCAMPFVWLYTEPPDIVISSGASCHAGALFFMVIEIVWPTVRGVEALSAT